MGKGHLNCTFFVFILPSSVVPFILDPAKDPSIDDHVDSPISATPNRNPPFVFDDQTNNHRPRHKRQDDDEGNDP